MPFVNDTRRWKGSVDLVTVVCGRAQALAEAAGGLSLWTGTRGSASGCACNSSLGRANRTKGTRYFEMGYVGGPGLPDRYVELSFAEKADPPVAT